MGLKFKYLASFLLKISALLSVAELALLSSAHGMMKTPCTGEPTKEKMPQIRQSHQMSEDMSFMLNQIRQDMANLSLSDDNCDGDDGQYVRVIELPADKFWGDLIWRKLEIKSKQPVTGKINSKSKLTVDTTAIEAFGLGKQFYSGHGVAQDLKEAVRCFKFAAKKGHIPSSALLGSIYLNGKGQIKKNMDSAIHYYTLAANAGDVNAQYELAHIYDDKKDFINAFKYFKLAAEQNHAPSIYCLGVMYEDAESVPMDFSAALSLYEKAALLNCNDALSRLGNLYKYGIKLKKDYVKAIGYFERSINDKYSQYELGSLYEKGLGVERNPHMAIHFYMLAAAQDHTPAYEMLGEIYYSLNEYVIALKNYKIGADAGRSFSQYSLAYMYERGQGVEQDYAKAFKYFELAAKQNEAIAAFKLGFLYALGQGVSRDKDMALKYLKLGDDGQFAINIPQWAKFFIDSHEDPAAFWQLALESDIGRASLILDEINKTMNPPVVSEPVSEPVPALILCDKVSNNDVGIVSAKWNNTVGKKRADIKQEKSLQRSLNYSESLPESMSIKSNEAAESLRRRAYEAFLVEGNFKALKKRLNNRVNLSDVVLTKKVFRHTLLALAELKVINYNDSGAEKSNTIHATFLSGTSEPSALTIHKHNHDLNWWENAAIRDDFFRFLGDCGITVEAILKTHS